MKINVKVTEVLRTIRGTSATFQNEDPIGGEGAAPGQLASFELWWSDDTFPIERGARFTLTLTAGPSEPNTLNGFGVPRRTEP